MYTYNKYGEYQHITGLDKMEEKLLTFEIAYVNKNNLFVKIFTFGCDTYRQVVEQLVY